MFAVHVKYCLKGECHARNNFTKQSNQYAHSPWRSDPFIDVTGM